MQGLGMAEKRFEDIVRVADTDLDGAKKLESALRFIKGVNFQMSRAIMVASGLNPSAKLNELSEEEIKKLESIIHSPVKFGVPAWLVNRRKDMGTGADVHLVATELDLSQRSDIDQMKKIRCYKGVRHEMGLPVRGQRTRSSFRTGGIVGVSRKAIKAAAAPAPATAAQAPKAGMGKAAAAPKTAAAPAQPAKPAEKPKPTEKK